MAGQPLVISNTTPMINLAEIGRMDVLQQLFGEIVIPPAVADELHEKRDLFPAVARAMELPFIRIVAPKDRSLVSTLTLELHFGEAECLALAMEQTTDLLLLLDELAARRVARHRKLNFTGTVGCLNLAKTQNLIPAIAPLFHDLRTKASFWLSDQVVEAILQQAGEKTL